MTGAVADAAALLPGYLAGHVAVSAAALALALAAVLAARRRPVLAGALAGLAFGFRFELGVAAILGACLEAPAARRSRVGLSGVALAVAPMVRNVRYRNRFSGLK